jgi:hypothetical protein
MLPRPFSPYSNPPRLHRRKRVTIIAGFQCTDGMLLCADTEQSLGNETKSQAHKIQVLHLENLKAAVGGSGDAPLCEFVTRGIFERLTHCKNNLDEIEDELKAYCRKIFTENMRVWRGFPKEFIPEVSFLIAIASSKGSRMFKWENNLLSPLHPQQHSSIGVGVLQSETLIQDIQFYYPSRQMLFFAVRMMQKVKQLVQGCGGKTEVVFLNQGGKLTWRPGIFKIDEIEHVSAMADEFLNYYALSFISGVVDQNLPNDDSVFRTHKEAMLNLRKEYLELLPSVILHKKE